MATLTGNGARLALGALALAATASAQEPRWPLANGSHDVLHSFQNPFYFSSYFHEGVDIRGNLVDVVAVRGGIVRYVNQGNSGGTLVVEVPIREGVTEADSYLHILIDPWTVGQRIEAGDVVGQVSNIYFGSTIQHHVHVNRFDGYAGGSGYVNGRTNMLHPLALFPPGPDRDPQQLPAALDDADEDGVVFSLVRSTSATQRLPFAYAGVDIVLEATDRLSDSLYWNQGLVSVAYWIESFAGGADVRDSSTPYRLVSFDDAWRSSYSNCDSLVTQALVSSSNYTVEYGPDNTGWSSLANYVITNTRGTTGSGSDVSSAEHWRTDARLGTGTQPNGSDASTAREIHEATFPDGRYVVHALVSDLGHEVEGTHAVIVDNYRPYVERVEVLDVRTGELLYDRGWAFSSATGTLEFFDALGDGLTGSSELRDRVRLRVTFSESVVDARLTKIEPPIGYLPRLRTTQPVYQRRVWEAEVPTVEDASFDGGHRLSIEAVDVGGTTLHTFPTTAPVAAPFNKRTSSTPIVTPAVDRLYRVPLHF